MVCHSGWWRRAPAAHAGEDLPVAADSAECADHYAAPPRWPQPLPPPEAARGLTHSAEGLGEHPPQGAAQRLPVPEHHGAQRVGQVCPHHAWPYPGWPVRDGPWQGPLLDPWIWPRPLCPALSPFCTKHKKEDLFDLRKKISIISTWPWTSSITLKINLQLSLSAV